MFEKKIEDATVQPDWDQNDSSAASYIQNRPFYKEENVEHLLDEQTLEFTTTDCSAVWGSDCVRGIANIPNSFDPENGSKVTVTFDGVDYECDVVSYAGVASRRVGPSDEPNTIGVVCPFTFYRNFSFDLASVDYNPEGYWTLFTSDTSNTQHTVSVKSTIESVTKIDSKFIPTPDWNQNDPNKDGYIDNRPFYSEYILSGYIVDGQVIETKTTEIINQMYECEGTFSVASLITRNSIQVGDIVGVVFDGIRYDLTVESDELVCEKRIGCQYPKNIGKDLPFSIYINWRGLGFEGVSGDAYVIASGEGKKHIIQVNRLFEHAHKIPSKYIDVNGFDTMEIVSKVRLDIGFHTLADDISNVKNLTFTNLSDLQKAFDYDMDVVLIRNLRGVVSKIVFPRFKRTTFVSGTSGKSLDFDGKYNPTSDRNCIMLTFGDSTNKIISSAYITMTDYDTEILEVYATP